MSMAALRRSRRGSGNLFFLPSRRSAAAVEFLEIIRLFLSKKLIMIEILRSFLLYQHVHFI
jgi:hypothetical protein